MVRLPVLWTTIAALCLLYVGMASLLYAFQKHLLYFPTHELTTSPRAVGLFYEDVTLQTEDGYRLHGWYLPAKGGQPTVLFFHGNAGNISHRLQTLSVLHRLGLNVLIIDYRGYGRSEGSPSEAGTYLDAQAAWRYLVDGRGIARSQIVIFGRSLGAGVATWLANHYTPGALILESAFTSIPDLAAKLYPFLPARLLARFQYDNHGLIGSIRCPVLVIHSRADEIIPFAHGLALYEAAREPKRFLAIQGSHNDGFLISADQYLTGISGFLDAVYASTENTIGVPNRLPLDPSH